MKLCLYKRGISSLSRLVGLSVLAMWVLVDYLPSQSHLNQSLPEFYPKPFPIFPTISILHLYSFLYFHTTLDTQDQL